MYVVVQNVFENVLNQIPGANYIKLELIDFSCPTRNIGKDTNK